MKKEQLLIALVAVIIGFAAGTIAGATITTDGSADESEAVTEEHSHSDDEAHSHDSMFMVDASEAPTVDFTVTEDTKSGWNITLNTTNFEFSPQNVGGENVLGEGHAHLYVDGEKVARLYSPNYHYDGKFDGTKTFRVTLNANDHSEYAIDGNVIDAELQVTHNAHN